MNINAFPLWEPIPWDLRGKAADEQERGFRRLATKDITWHVIPPEGIFGYSCDWFQSNEIDFFAVSDGEDLVLISRMYFGFPDPPQYGLASRPSGCSDAEWAMWGSFPNIPKTWYLPGQQDFWKES